MPILAMTIIVACVYIFVLALIAVVNMFRRPKIVIQIQQPTYFENAVQIINKLKTPTHGLR